MEDQATKLRRLVSRMESVDGKRTRACRVVISGSKGGVGATTIAIGLAVALRKHAQRVLLIDANPQRGDVAATCHLKAAADIDDFLSGKLSLSECVSTGPGDIQILPRFGANLGPWGATTRQLARQVNSWSAGYEYVIVDAGSCPLAAEMLWPLAEFATIVTTPDTLAITNAYATIKSLAAQRVVSELRYLVNQCETGALAT